MFETMSWNANGQKTEIGKLNAPSPITLLPPKSWIVNQQNWGLQTMIV